MSKLSSKSRVSHFFNISISNNKSPARSNPLPFVASDCRGAIRSVVILDGVNPNFHPHELSARLLPLPPPFPSSSGEAAGKSRAKVDRGRFGPLKSRQPQCVTSTSSSSSAPACRSDFSSPRRPRVRGSTFGAAAVHLIGVVPKASNDPSDGSYSSSHIMRAGRGTTECLGCGGGDSPN